ncbi:MAG: choline-sulfatase [Candidatus Sumerlaeota bacterium]|nr:choline-sulfatase [Candidatus Sumerlaeota bacterium]
MPDHSTLIPSSSPNILFIMADQLAASAVGAYGNPVVRTPRLDRLAREGARFETAYCNNPICGPSRCSMVAGRIPSAIGIYDNANELPAAQPTFLHELRLAGYQTILSGKMHFVGPDQLHGFEERLTTDIYPSGFHWTANWDRGAYHNPGTCVERLDKSGPCDASCQIDYDEEVLYQARQKLRDLARREDPRPFFLCASFTHPHDLFHAPRQYWDLYRNEDIPAPAAPAVPLDQMHPFNRWISIHHMVDVFPPSEETVRKARRAYYAMVSYFDALVGQLLADLERLGLAGNTIVAVTTDHGEMLGEHGMWFKRTFFEDAMRVPLIWRGPGIPAGRIVKQIVSLLDLYRTLVDLSGVPDAQCAFEGVEGASFRHLLEGRKGEWKDRAVGEYTGEGAIQPMRLLRKGPWKYVNVWNEPPLLFNLEDDPREQRNRIGDPEVARIEEAMREELLAGYDGEALRERIVADQRRRRGLHAALMMGKATPWDFTPTFPGHEKYVRKWDAQETTRRKLV